MLLAVACAPALAATSLYVYDALGRLIAEIDPSGGTTRYTYDPAGNLLSVTRDSSTGFRIDGFTPSSGKVGDAVTIFGGGFVTTPSQNTVRFNGTTAAVNVATANSLVVSVPAGATSGPISVSNVNDTATSAQPFIVIAPPVIAGTSPAHVSRGQTSVVEIHGTHLDSATSVSFSQPGLSARIVARAPTSLTIELTVAGSVPFGSYEFSVTNYAGTTLSGAVTVNVTTALLGDVTTVSRALSVHVPAVVPGAPAGNSLSVTRALSVHIPALVPGAPAGNAMSVSGSLSVHLPAVVSGAPAGNGLSVSGSLSVHVPALVPGAPPGNAMSVTQPLSVSMP